MFDTHEWNNIEGEEETENLTLFSLSTCGFCASARKYLVSRGLAFHYLELDHLSPEKKAEIISNSATNSDTDRHSPPS